MGKCYTKLEPHEKKLLRIRSPENKLSISRFFDKKFSLKKLEVGKVEAEETKSEKPSQLQPKVQKRKIVNEFLGAPVDSKLLSISMGESERNAEEERASESREDVQFLAKNDYIKQKMFCRLMHTKRGNLWNELHKLDRKRIKLLMNKFVIQKDHEAMQYIIRNQQKELVERHCQIKQRMAKVDHIKQTKAKRKEDTLKRLRDLERRNFESVLRYLQDTIPKDELERMLAQARMKVAKICAPSKRPRVKKPEQAKRGKLQIGKKKLFGKLAKINSDLYRQVYQETQKKFRGSRGGNNRQNPFNTSGQVSRSLEKWSKAGESGSISEGICKNTVDFGQDFHQLYIRESMKVGRINGRFSTMRRSLLCSKSRKSHGI